MTSQPAPKQRRPLSPEALAYLEKERDAETKSEFHSGTIVAMEGTSFTHANLVYSFVGQCYQQFMHSPCVAVSNDIRVYSEECEAFFYPDVVILCDPPVNTAQNPPSITNPLVIIEVLSPSTEGNDRGFKFQCYRTIPSLREYVLIAQNRVLVEHYVRQNETMWLLQTLTDLNAILSLESCEVSISLTELYARVFTP